MLEYAPIRMLASTMVAIAAGVCLITIIYLSYVLIPLIIITFIGFMSYYAWIPSSRQDKPSTPPPKSYWDSSNG